MRWIDNWQNFAIIFFVWTRFCSPLYHLPLRKVSRPKCRVIFQFRDGKKDNIRALSCARRRELGNTDNVSFIHSDRGTKCEERNSIGTWSFSPIILDLQIDKPVWFHGFKDSTFHVLNIWLLYVYQYIYVIYRVHNFYLPALSRNFKKLF